MDIRVTRFTGFEEVRRRSSEWERLLEEESENHLFMTLDWLTAWWECFGDGQELCLLLLEEGDTLVGAAPLAICRRGPIKVIRFVGSGLTDYLDFLLPRPHAARVECLELILNYLRTAVPGWSMIELAEVPEGTGSASALREVLSKSSLFSSFRTSYSCPYVDLSGSSAEFMNRRPRKSRYKNKRNLKKLAEQGTVSFVTYRRPEELDGALDKAFCVHGKRWANEAGATALFSSPKGRRFFGEITPRYAQRGWLELTALEVSGRLVAFSYAFVYRQKLIYYVPSFDPDFAPFSPGVVLLNHLLEQASLRKMKEFDFARGEEGYKSRWATHERRNLRILIGKRDLIGVLVFFGCLGYWVLRDKARRSPVIRRLRQEILRKKAAMPGAGGEPLESG